MKAAPSSKKIGMNIVYTLIVGTIGLAGYTLYVGKTQTKTEIETSESSIPTNANPLKSFRINNERDTTILFESGSLIEIKKGTFLDENKKPVHGSVTLKYREFHKVSETLLAGIPMDFDSAGTKYHFESAGMFEIQAEAENKSLVINNESPIQVKLVSIDPRKSKFNQYYLENTEGKWISKGKDVPIEIKPPSTTPIAKSTTEEKIIPKILNPQRAQFDIEIPKSGFPELAEFNNLLFEVSPRNKDFDPSKTNENWNDVTIAKTEIENEYKFTFLGINKRYEVLAYPVLDSLNYAKSLKKFNQIHTHYISKKADKNKRDSILNKQVEVFQKVVNNARNFFATYKGLTTDSAIINGLRKQEDQSVSEIVYRSFQVKNFGFYNSDCPSMLPDDLIVKADFVDNKGIPIVPQKIFLVEKSKNKIYTYYSADALGFIPKEENVLIVVTKKHIYSADSDSFKEIKKNTKAFTFSVLSKFKKSYTEKDIDELL